MRFVRLTRESGPLLFALCITCALSTIAVTKIHSQRLLVDFDYYYVEEAFRKCQYCL